MIKDNRMVHSVELFAQAKVNLGLWVGSPAANGYHPIDTIMHTVEWADSLVIRDHHRYQLTVPHYPQLATDDNLVTRAYHWLLDQGAELPPVSVTLYKRIPTGAGLGGGSSDAAAVLRWAQSLGFAGNASVAELGMDVPFFLCQGAARARGFGEQLTPLAQWPGLGLLLMNPGFEVSTKMVYQAYDIMDNQGDCAIDELERLWQRRQMPDHFCNVLEPAAWRVAPALKDFKDALTRWMSPFGCYLSGSGGTYYSIGLDPDQLEWYQDKLLNCHVPWVVATRLTGE